MTDTAPLDCLTIVERFTANEILSTVRDFLARFKDYSASLSDEDLFVFAFAKYEGTQAGNIMTQARGRGDYARWISDRALPCYMASWFIEASK